MRKLVGLMLVSVLMFCVFLEKGYASPDATDNFTITVTISMTLGITLKDVGDVGDYTTWAIGSKAAGASVTMSSATGIHMVNTCTVPVSIFAIAANSTGGGNWAAAGTADTDKYKLEFVASNTKLDNPIVYAGTKVLSTTEAVFNDNLVVGTSPFIYGQFTLPTASSSGQPQSIVVTFNAYIH
jgi:hypothetical protein